MSTSKFSFLSPTKHTNSCNHQQIRQQRRSVYKAETFSTAEQVISLHTVWATTWGKMLTGFIVDETEALCGSLLWRGLRAMRSSYTRSVEAVQRTSEMVSRCFVFVCSCGQGAGTEMCHISDRTSSSHQFEPCDIVGDVEGLRSILPLILVDVENPDGQLAATNGK